MKVYSVYLERNCTSPSEDCPYKEHGIHIHGPYTNSCGRFSIDQIHDKTLREARVILKNLMTQMVADDYYHNGFFGLCQSLFAKRFDNSDEEDGLHDLDRLLRVDQENFKTRRFKELPLRYVLCEKTVSKTKKPEVGAFRGIFSSPYEAKRWIDRNGSNPSFTGKEYLIIETENDIPLESTRINERKFVPKPQFDFVLYVPKGIDWRKKEAEKRLINYTPTPINSA